MRGNTEIVAFLNRALADELSAINQYMVHSEMCDNWGYNRLHEKVEKRAIQEMKHAEILIARILFLEGIPEVSKLNQLHIGVDIQKQLDNDLLSENSAASLYNEGIVLCASSNDAGTREILENILEDEEDHIDWLETQLDQIQQIGIQNYLTEQMRKD